jgi:hypothetical protein
MTVAVLAVGCGGSVGLDDPDPPVGSSMLPDLVPLPALDVQMLGRRGRWAIQFSSILVNVGVGDFILRAKRFDHGPWNVEQDVPFSTSGAKVVPTNARVVWGGDGHNHWHISRVAVNELVPLDSRGKPAWTKKRADAKIGFCFYDFSKQLVRGPDKARFRHQSCGKRTDDVIGMGLSVGWGDTYVLTLPGQSIDVTDLPDGRYRLYSRADPRKWFQEASHANNLTWIDLELASNGSSRFAKVIASGPSPV